MSGLAIDGNGVGIQTVPLIEGQIGVGSTDGVGSDGIFTAGAGSVLLVECVTDGTFTITFNTDTEKEMTVSEGWEKPIMNCSQIEITSGTFNVA